MGVSGGFLPMPGAGDILPDRADAPCAACGSSHAGTRQTVEGKLLMLCNNAVSCASRYRQGLTPEQYAARLRNGVER